MLAPFANLSLSLCVCVCVCRKYKNPDESVGGLKVPGMKFPPSSKDVIEGFKGYTNVVDFDSKIQVHRIGPGAPGATRNTTWRRCRTLATLWERPRTKQHANITTQKKQKSEHEV